MELLGKMNVELVADPLRVKYIPDGSDLKPCYELGLKIAARLKEKHGPASR